jgi:uncharacterized Fe-S cluster protein YjdI
MINLNLKQINQSIVKSMICTKAMMCVVSGNLKVYKYNLKPFWICI